MTRNESLAAKIAEFREAAKQARALSEILPDPKAQHGFMELAVKLDAEADAMELKSKK